MKLIRAHQPASRRELEDLISWHAVNRCECGIKSQGTIESFGRNLYNAQYDYWGVYRYSLKECIQWEYDVFITQSLKGGLMEKKGILKLKEQLPDFNFTQAEGYMDEELRIDIIFEKNNRTLGGIQIKPLTFMKMRAEVITFNHSANKKWDRPVYYLYYDQHEKFINFNEVVTRLQTQTSNTS